jgi:hypothetical protein
VGRGVVDAVDLQGGGVQVEGLHVVAAGGGLDQEVAQGPLGAVVAGLDQHLGRGPRACLPGLGPRVHHQGDQQLPARVLECALAVGGVGHGVVDEPGAEVGLHDAVWEADPVAARLDQAEPHAEGRGQADVDPAGPPVLLQRRPQGVDQRRVLGLGLVPGVGRGRGLRRVVPGQALEVALEVVEPDVQAVLAQPDAGQGRQLLHGDLAFIAAEGQPGREVAVEQGLHPGLEQADAELGPVHAAGVEPLALAPVGDEVQQPQPAQLAGDLEVQGRLGHVGGLHDPVQAVLVIAAAALLDELQGRLLAERLQLDDGGVQDPQRVVGPGGDDEGQPGVVGPPDGQADQGVALLLDLALDERLLQAVGEDHDPVVLDELAPDLLALGVRQQLGVGLGQEPQPGQLAEVEPALGVAQPDRHRHRPALGQQLGQPDQQGRLARADAADDHMGTPAAPVAQVVDHHLAELVAADHLADDAARGLHHLPGPLAGGAHERPVHPGVPVQQEHRGRQGQRGDGQQDPGQGVAVEVGVLAGLLDVHGEAGRPAGQHDIQCPADPEHEQGRDHVGGQPPDPGPQAASMPGPRAARPGPARVGAAGPDGPGERPVDPGQQPPQS